MNNNTDTQITPAQLLTAAREGKITATVIDSETLPPLAGGDGPEQYPACTIALGIITAEGVARGLPTDQLTSGRGTYDFRAVPSDGVTRGDCQVIHDDSDGDTLREIVFRPGEGMPSSIPVLSLYGLTESEAEEVREAIENAITDAYEGWEPEHPEESEIYAALTKGRETSEVEYLVGGTKNHAGEFIRVRLYAGTHCGQPQFALEPMDGAEDTTVYESASEAARAARVKLMEMLQAAIDDTAALDKQEREAAEALESAISEKEDR